jgi:hypothetical protein
MLLLTMGMYDVKLTADEIPPPGAGVVTVKERFPGGIRFSGTAAVNCVELTNVVGTAVPFTATTLVCAKPVPANVAVKGTLNAPEVGVIDVRVGTGGLTMLSDKAFDSEGLANGVLTVMLTVPVADSRLAGIGAEIYPEA